MNQRLVPAQRAALAIAALLLAHPAELLAATHPQRPASQAAGYLPPTFHDPDRAGKVRALTGQITKIYTDFAAEAHCPGVAFGVVVDDALVVSGGLGYTDIRARTPATTRSVFRIASMTKSFTALSVLRLRDQGRIDLDRPLSGYLPEMRGLKGLTSDSPAITARHLLTHGGGFPEDNPWGDRQLADTEQQLIDLIRGPIRFSTSTGTEYEYSNVGFAVLGRLVHRVSGSTCQDYIDRNVLRPLGMASTYWQPAKVPPDLLAHGYRWLDGEWREESLLADGSYAPMGGLMTSIEDFSRYMALHLAAWPPRDDAENGPLRRSSLREMHHPWRMNALDTGAMDPQGKPCPTAGAYAYGLGWSRDCQQRVSIGHGGGLPGFGSNWRIYPEHGFGVVSFGNVTYAGISRANRKVADLLLTVGELHPRRLPPSGILRQRARELTRLLPAWADAEHSGLFAQNFFLDYPIASLRRDAQGLFDGIGDVVSEGEVEPENQLRGTFLVHGKKGDVRLTFTLTPENPPLIQEFSIVRIPEPDSAK